MHPLKSPSAAPSPEFDVRQFGAVGDGRTLDTAAINRAIDAVRAIGGGTVSFPAGDYLSHSIRLCSHLTLRLGAGARLIAAEPGGYDAPEEGPPNLYQDYGHSRFRNSLIWGEGLEHVTLCGSGIIFGRGLSRGNGRVALPVGQVAPQPPGHLPDVLEADGEIPPLAGVGEPGPGPVERHEHGVRPDRSGDPSPGDGGAARRGDRDVIAVVDGEPARQLGVQLDEGLGGRAGQRRHPTGLGAGLVVRQHPAGDQVDRPVAVEVVGRRTRGGGDHPRPTVRVREALGEHPRRSVAAGRAGPEESLGDRVEPGCTVDLRYEGDTEAERYFFGSVEERGVEHDIISPGSPLGQALQGKEVGDKVDFESPAGGTLTVEVVAIS